jgi:hypothetical protein
MPILTRPSSAPGMSLSYITIGALLAIWSSVWYLMGHPETQWARVFCTGLFLTGLVLLAIGFGVGYIGRAARHAELPPVEATAAVARESLANPAAGNRVGVTQPVANTPPATGNTVIQG